jgi:Ca2+-binding EF-hand superfamily protein
MQVTHEAIDLCYGEEIEEISRAAREAFAAMDPGGKNTLSRHEFRSCIMSRSERFSMQEVQMLMQMCKEDDFQQVPYDDFQILLQQLRIDSLHNALVETDVESLRIHLILLLRREGMQTDPVIPVWSLRNVLLSADQLCLSRMQIHVILSIVHPSEQGEVDVEYFLRVVCTVIPYMFDAATFMEKASTIQKEKADALAKAELEELQGLTSSLATKRRTDEGEEEDVQANAPDRDAVEKALIHHSSQYDEKHRAQPTLQIRKFMDAMQHESVQQCQLSDAELRGFVAEADIDERQEIQYVEHIKMWVPIIFELRKSRVYDNILAKDWGAGATCLVDLSDYELRYPLLGGAGEARETRRRPSQSRLNDRRPSSRSRQSYSRSSTKGNEDYSNLAKKGKKDKGRPASRSDKDRPASRQKGRPASRTGSVRSLQRTDSSDSAGSNGSQRSAASVASHVSRSSRR